MHIDSYSWAVLGSKRAKSDGGGVSERASWSYSGEEESMGSRKGMALQ